MERTTTKAASRFGVGLAINPNRISRIHRWIRRTFSPNHFLNQLIVVLTCAWLLPVSAAPIQYFYDELGRLTGVIDAAGNGATYNYDATGNLTQAGPTAAVSIMQFTPSSGPVGTAVTIQGTGFKTVAAQNTVKFNGVTATISGTPTVNKIIAIVPAAATTGPISVTTSTGSASAAPFTVTPSRAPTITNFTPDTGIAGTAVTITGTNYESSLGNNKVTFNGRFAKVTSATSTSLASIAPAGVSSGKIVVSTPYGQATSATDFFVPPAGYVPTDIDARGRFSVGGAGANVNIATAGKVGLFLFDGTQNQYLGLGVSNIACSAGGSVTIRIYKPDTSQLVSNNASAPGASFDLPRLTSSGTHSILILPPAGATCSMTLTLSVDIAGTLTANGTAVTFSTTRIGQNGRYTFTGTAGKSYSLLWTDATIPGVWSQLRIYKPDGIEFTNSYFDNGVNGRATGTIDFTNLPTTGTYTVFVDPYVTSVGNITLALKQDVAGTLLLDGAVTNISLAAGQNGNYTFTGFVGQTLGLGISNLVTTPTGGVISGTVTSPNGVRVATCSSISVPGSNCNIDKLPAAGTYTVRIDPQGTNAITGTLTLSRDIGAAMTLNAAASTFTTTRVGQNGRYTFAGTAGQNVTLSWSGSTFPGFWSYFYILKPDGSNLNATNFADGSNGSGQFDLTNLPVTGTYTIFIDPLGVGTGLVNVQVLGDVAGTLAVDGATTAVALTSGQNGRYTFSGSSGQNLGLGVSSFTTTPAGGSVSVALVGPAGAISANCQGTTAPGFNCNFPSLPATGSYTVVVNPSGSYAANLTLSLSSDLVGTLTLNAAATNFSTLRAGQNGRYTFAATAGQNLTLLWSGGTFPGFYSVAYVYKPDGALLNSGIFADGTSGNGQLDLNNLPATGTYSVVVDPNGAGTGSINLQIVGEVTGAIAVDGAPTTVALAAGQNGRFTFAGTAGQSLGLGVSGLATTPVGGNVSVSVFGPTGSLTSTCSGSAAPGYSCNLVPLPASGTYTVRVDPSGANAANLTLTLSNNVIGSMTPDAAATNFATSRVGQDARYTFNATAGQNLSLLWSGSTFPGFWSTANVYKPDGSLLTSFIFADGTSGNGTGELRNLPATGTYTLHIDPVSIATGTVNMQLLSEVTGTLALDGASTIATLASGKNGRFTFNGTAGQNVGIGISALSTTPTGGSVGLVVYAPDGSVVSNSCPNNTAPGGNCNLFTLPVTGTYVVLADTVGISAANFTLTLSSDVNGTVVVGGAAATFNAARVGQNARYTFAAIAGQNISIPWSGNTFPATGYVSIYKPDGTALNTFSLSGASGAFVLNNLPATGNFALFVDPCCTNVGQVAIGVTVTGTTPPAGQTVDGTLTIDGTATAIALATSGTARYTFNGTVGQTLGLGMSGIVTTPSGGSVSIQVTLPDNTTQLVNCSSVSTTGGSCNLPALPSNGTYTVRLAAASTYAANVSLALSTDVVGTLVPNGATAAFTTTRPGQNGRYTFTATVGQNLSLLWSSGTIAGIWSYIYVYKPDGAVLRSQYFSDAASGAASGTLDLGALPAAGTYTVFVDPYGTNTGGVNLALKQDAGNTLAIDGAATTVALASGQNGRYTFAGVVGQNLGLGISGVVTAPAGGLVAVTVLLPDRTTQFKNCSTYAALGGNCNLPTLPATGSYTIVVDPNTPYAADLTLTLSSDVAGTLTVGSAPVAFNAARPGQNGRYTFTGSAGQNISLLWSGSNFAGVWSYFNVYNPDGTLLRNQYFSDVSNGLASGTLDFSLPSSGTYTLMIDPYGTVTGGVSMQLTTDTAGTLALDGAPLAVSLVAGQNGRYTFTGSAGQTVGLGISGLATAPTGGSVGIQVLSPTGTTFSSGCSNYTAPGGNCNLRNLPATGTYTVVLDPQNTNAANLTLNLSSAITGVLALDSAPTAFATTRVGQDGLYTFSGIAGQKVSLVWSGGTIPGTWSYFYIYKPDGTALYSQYFSDAATGAANGTLDLSLTDTGTYSILVDPFRANTGGVNLQLLSEATGVLALNGASTVASLPTGRNGRYTFNGTAGQNLGLGISGLSTTPAGGSISVVITSPAGYTVTSCTAAGTGGSCNLRNLPATGTYIVAVDPSGVASADFTLALSSSLTGTLPVNGAIATFTTTRVGQDGRYTFSGTAGQNLTVHATASTFSTLSLNAQKADGSDWLTSNFSGATSDFALINLPATGTYVLNVDPISGATGNVTLGLTNP